MSVLKEQPGESRSVGETLQRAVHEASVAQIGQSHCSVDHGNASVVAQTRSIVAVAGVGGSHRTGAVGSNGGHCGHVGKGVMHRYSVLEVPFDVHHVGAFGADLGRIYYICTRVNWSLIKLG